MDIQVRPRHKHRIPYWSCDTGQLSVSVGRCGQVSQAGLGNYLREIGGVPGKSGELPQHQAGEVGFWGQIIP